MSKWPTMPLEAIVSPVERLEIPIPGKPYRQVGVRLWGEGAYERELLDGGETKYKTLSRVEADDIVVNKIWARNGSVAVVSKKLAGSYVSGEFPTFKPAAEKLEPRWFHWLTKTPTFWEQCDAKSRGTSGKNRIRPEQFLEIEIPLPPLPEQRRIVARIESLAAKIEEGRKLRGEVYTDLLRLVSASYHRIADNAPRRPLGEVAPLDRRPVTVDFETSYPQVAVRSFGRGTFHKPPLVGSEVTWEKPFLVKAGDILVSNIKAWEGAIAVAGPDDDGRVGSHRYLTCVTKQGIATARFICFHLLTPEGLYEVGEASPGSADRNRTLNSKTFLKTPVPVPDFHKQLWFDRLCEKADLITHAHSESEPELAALLPSILDKAFKGEL